jgi:hypothetical protein
MADDRGGSVRRDSHEYRHDYGCRMFREFQGRVFRRYSFDMLGGVEWVIEQKPAVQRRNDV